MRHLLLPAFALSLAACSAGQLGDPCTEDDDCAGDLWCHIHDDDDDDHDDHEEGFCDDEHGRH